MEELDTKDNSTESSKHESDEEQELEHRLGEKKSASLDKLKMEVVQEKTSEVQATGSLAAWKKRIQELEVELDKRKESETNLFDSLVMQTKRLEQSKMLLEESKLEIASIRRNIEGSAAHNMKSPDESQDGPSTKETTETPEIEDQQVENMLTGAQDVEELASLTNEIMLEKMRLLQNKLKLATEAEENGKKAMDDLAIALKEVATEANQVKEKLTLSQVELEHTKELLEETRKEADGYKNIAERLRSEAEELLSAWNAKETGFVNCIRGAEEERSAAQQETTRLLELLAVAESKTMVSKEENQKLRDVLKQVLNEANVAKEATGIARAENSRLQDSLARKEETLSLLGQENEMLKIHETAAFENIKELKRLLSESSLKELKNEDKEKLSTKEANKEDKEVGRKANLHHATDKERKEGKNLTKTLSSNLKETKNGHEQPSEGNEEANEEKLTHTRRLEFQYLMNLRVHQTPHPIMM